MKKYILLWGLLFAFSLSSFAQQTTSNTDVLLNNNMPTGFNYQALIYADGKPVAEKEVKLRITLQDENTPYLVEEHTAKTTNTGWVEILVGSKKPADMENVPWEKNLYVKVEVDLGVGNYILLGQPVKMEPVPYALVARTAPIIKGNGDKETPIFQVRNSQDLPIFTVYEDAISMNVAEQVAGTRRPRGGFAVKSFSNNVRGTNLTTRLAMDDGAFSIYVDPVTRRPRGGFAVKTLKTSRGDSQNTETLFSMDERSTYFTIDQCQVGSTFQFRDRNEESKIIMNIKDGYIQTPQGSNKNTVMQKLPDGTTASLNVSWPLPGESAPTAASLLLEFTNLIRWRVPYVVSAGQEVAYNIAIEDIAPNAQGKNLSDYFTVGKILKCTKDGVTYKKQEAEAIMLKSNVKLVAGEKYPNGNIVISWAEYPNVVNTFSVNTTKDLLAREDLLLLAATMTPLEPNETSFVATLSGDPITQNAYWPEVAYNIPMRLAVIDRNYENFIKVINREGDKVYFQVSDYENLYKAIVDSGSTLVGANTYSVRVSLMATFPNAVYPNTNVVLELQVKSK